MRNTLKKVMGAVMVVALLVGVLAVPSQDAQAASENHMESLKLNWDLKKNKTVKFRVVMNVIKGINVQGKITDYKIVKAPKVGYKKLTFTVTFKDDFKKPSNGQIHKMASDGQQAGMDWFSVADYDTGLSLERKNKFNVTVKSSWKVIQRKKYKDNHNCYIEALTQRANVSITYPEEYDGLCIGVGGQNQFGASRADKQYWAGRGGFGKTSYYKTGKKNSHWMRVRASKEKQPTTTSQPQATKTPVPTTSPSGDISATKPPTPTTSPSGNAPATSVPTSSPSGDAPAPTESPDVTPEIRTIVYDGIDNSEILDANEEGEPFAVVVQDGVTSIGDEAFNECNNLIDITIPDSVQSIGEYAFCYCSSLTSINIPSSVTSIKRGAFCGCSGITSIEIPSGILSIEDNIFWQCNSLNSVLIPNSVTSIGSAFGYCSSLTNITIPDGVSSIGSEAFYNCSSLTSITIPDGVSSIGSGAFYNCSSLTSITIPDGISSIGRGAFYMCSSLTSITWKGTTYTSAKAFADAFGFVNDGEF